MTQKQTQASYNPLAFVYGHLLQKGILPSAVDEQDPDDFIEAFFSYLNAMNEEAEEQEDIKYSAISPMYWEMFT